MNHGISGSAGVNLSSVDDCSDTKNDNNNHPNIEKDGKRHQSSSVLSRASSSSLSLISLSAISMLTLLSGVEGYSTDQTSNATIVTTGAATSTESTSTIATTTSHAYDGSLTVGAILAVIMIAIVILFFGITCKTLITQAARRIGIIDVAERQRRGGVDIGAHIGGDVFGNGNAMMGGRDPDDNPGEIMEINEAQWGWGYVPGEIIPMVMMGGARGDEEEEAEDAM